MSEYWKSTPKYWCKHCKTFVRDSKLEKQNHEATPKHQGNLQRFLRDLHRNNEREAREKQRGKDEVARLKGITNHATFSANAPPERKSATTSSSDSRQATAADRKRQLQQLAELGIAVPEEARREMAMAGDWHIQSVTPVYERTEKVPKKEEDDEDRKTAALAVGVHKRKLEGDEEKEEAGERVVKRGWGSTTRTWHSDDKDDLEALLSSTKAMKQSQDEYSGELLVEGSSTKVSSGNLSSTRHDEEFDFSAVKREDDDAGLVMTETSAVSGQPSILFKKRKSKQIRQKE